MESVLLTKQFGSFISLPWRKEISVQKRPFCDFALWHMLLNSWETTFRCSATTASECLLCSGEISDVLIATLGAEFFSSEKFQVCYSATLLPQWQSFSHLKNILLLCYSTTWVAEFFSFVLFCYSALFNSSKFFHQSASVLVWIRLGVNL